MKNLDRFRLQSARRLRANMTDEERILWSHLWRIPVEGTHFRKQAPLGPYVPDFVSHRLRLIIEIDGFQHRLEPGIARDAKRTAWLEAEGYRVLRFWTHEVRRELEAVLDTIYAVVAELSESAQHPTPSLRADPPHQGEGKETGEG